MPVRFEVLLETIAGLAAANVVIIETLHERKLVDKTHFAHAFGRALDTLAPELRGGMTEHTLRSLRDRCMNAPAHGVSDFQEWLGKLLDADRARNRAED
jgi:hypothetical protein